MRLMVAILSFMSATTVWATNPVHKCQPQAEELVKSLEGVLADIEGMAQGDYNEFLLYTTVKADKGYSVTLNVSSDHMNEDNEGWTQDYEVTYTVSGDYCYIQSYVYLGSQGSLEEESSTCIDENQAKTNLAKYLAPHINTIPIDDFSWLDEEDTDSVFTQKEYDSALQTLAWDIKDSQFITDVVIRGDCGPSVSCWGGYTVSCEGDVFTWFEGEE